MLQLISCLWDSVLSSLALKRGVWEISFLPSLFDIVGYCPPGGMVSPFQDNEVASPSVMDGSKAPESEAQTLVFMTWQDGRNFSMFILVAP